MLLTILILRAAFKNPFSFFIMLTLCFWGTKLSGQNLLVNPGAETSGPTAAGGGWTLVSQGAIQGAGAPIAGCYSSANWRIIGNQNGYPVAHGGSYYFFPGCATNAQSGNGASYEIYQDVNISANASEIDAGMQSFTFSGYMQDFTQATPDGTQIIVEFRDHSNALLSTPINSGLLHSQGVWVKYSPATVVATSGTRYVRVRLIGKNTDGNSIDTYFDDLSLTTNLGLPIHLFDFKCVENKNNSVTVSWQTVSEENNDYFIIERSRDGINFESIGQIAGAGNSEEMLSYSFDDKEPKDGLSYYRLTQTDYNGKSVTFSEVPINVTDMSVNLFSVYPNPNNGKEINILFKDGNKDENINFILCDAMGKVIINKNYTFEISGENIFNLIPDGGLKTGIYFVRCYSDTKSFSRKLIIN